MSISIKNRKISELIREQFPHVYLEQGETFVAFVEAYQEWLDQQQLNYKIYEYQDIDLTLKEFLTHFKKEFLSLIPNRIVGDERIIIKHILDLYRAKGSKQGYKLLFRLLYNEDIEVYIPGDDIIAPSDAEWYEPYYLEITPHEINEELIGKRIIGSASGAEAVVETYIKQQATDKIVDVLYISNKIGNFIVGEKIIDENRFASVNLIDAPTILGSLTSISFVQGGQNYQVGQRLKVIDGKGVSGEVRITDVANGTGTILFTIINGGTGYSMDAEEIITRSEPANAAIRGRGASFDIGALSDVQEITYDERLMYDTDAIMIANTTVNKVQVVNGGSGYSNASTVTFTNDRGIENIVVKAGGTGYLNSDTVVVSGPGSNVVANVVTFPNSSVKEINISSIGKGFTSVPTVTISSNTGTGVVLTVSRTGLSGSGANATVNTFSNGTIQSITVTNGGSGYQLTPRISVSGGTGANLTCNIHATDYDFNPFFGVDANTLIGNGLSIQSKYFGKIVSLTNISTGNNYQSPPTVKVFDFIHTNILPGNIFFTTNSTIVTGVGTSFLTYFDANTANSAVQKNKILLIGSPSNLGNTEHRIITQVTNNTHMVLDDTPNYSANGEIKVVNVSNGGSGYINTDTVIVTGSGGSGANLSIVTDNSGTIIDVEINSRGAGWRLPPTVSVTSNTGTGGVLVSEIYYGACKSALHLLEVNYSVYDNLQPDQTQSGNNAVILADPVYGSGIIKFGQVKNSGFGYDEDELVVLAPYGAIDSITIKSGGTGYVNSENLVISGGAGGTGGAGFITTNGNGTITAVTISSPGSGYVVPPNITVRSANGKNASILCTVGGLNQQYYVSGQVQLSGQGKALGQWLNTKGFLNSDKYIQDSFYYQEYSYELRTGLTLNYYANIIKSIYHPAGLELFGAVVIKDTVDNKLEIQSETITG